MIRSWTGRLVGAALALLLAVFPAGGQTPEEGTAARSERGGAEQRPEAARLPPDRTSRHKLALAGRDLVFEATAGSVPLVDRQGRLEAEIGFVAYVLADGARSDRPVTFVVNGGPGASSAYLHLGVLGPWRLPLGEDSISPSRSPALVPNAETWLDFTDLVFIDPVGTGYSRLARPTDELRGRYLSVEGDIDALADFVSRWLVRNGRLAAPKFFVGESYGGFRGPLLADKLQTDHGIGLSGITLVSPVLDFGWREQPAWAPLPKVSVLPSLAAAALEARGTPATRAALAPVERYAAGEFVTDLLLGLQDEEAVARLSRRVAEVTGLEPDLVRRLAGRVDMQTFARETLRADARVASVYDTGITGDDPAPNALFSRHRDPLLQAMTAPLTSAVVDLTERVLAWRPDRQYQLLNGGVSGAWRWGAGRGQPEAVSELRQALALDPALQVLVVHGFTDLVTPYFESELILRQIRDFNGRVRLSVYSGGHMFYTREASRRAFRDDGAALYARALAARRAVPGD